MIRGMFLSSTADSLEIRLSRVDDEVKMEIDFGDGDGPDTLLMTSEFAHALGEALTIGATLAASHVNPEPEPCMEYRIRPAAEGDRT